MNEKERKKKKHKCAETDVETNLRRQTFNCDFCSYLFLSDIHIKCKQRKVKKMRTTSY